MQCLITRASKTDFLHSERQNDSIKFDRSNNVSPALLSCLFPGLFAIAFFIPIYLFRQAWFESRFHLRAAGVVRKCSSEELSMNLFATSIYTRRQRQLETFRTQTKWVDFACVICVPLLMDWWDIQQLIDIHIILKIQSKSVWIIIDLRDLFFFLNGKYSFWFYVTIYEFTRINISRTVDFTIHSTGGDLLEDYGKILRKPRRVCFGFIVLCPLKLLRKWI